jgi:hypothetical protein
MIRKMKQTLLIAGTATAALLMPALANATTYNVWLYEGTGTPPRYDIDDASFVLQQALRSWERASGNRIRFLYNGITDSPGYPGANQILVQFGDATGPFGGQPYCGYTAPTLFGGYYITIHNDPATGFWAATQTARTHVESELPILSTSRCVDLLPLYMHEFGHIVQHGIDEHDIDSTRGVWPSTSFTERTPWNRDHFEISSLYHGGGRDAGIRIGRFDPWTLGETQLAQSWDWHMRFPTAAIAPGAWPGEESLVSFAFEDWTTDPPDLANMGLEVRRYGANATYLGSRMLRGTDHPEYATRHPMCIASSGSNRVLMAWASVHEQPPLDCGGPLCPFSGSRAIMTAWSTDGGFTFGTPQALPYAFTKSGVSCTYDPTEAKFVVGYSGSGEERLWLTSRSWYGAWSSPRPLPPVLGRMLTPSTNEVPHLLADSGRMTLAWFDNVEGPVIGELDWSPWTSQYEWTGTPLKPTAPVTDQQINGRLIAIPSAFAGVAHALFSVFTPNAVHWLDRRTVSPGVISASGNGFVPYPEFKYLGAARTRTTQQLLTLSPMRQCCL